MIIYYVMNAWLTKEFSLFISSSTCNTLTYCIVVMRRKMMLKEVIFFVKLSLFPIWCWPEPQDATKFKIFCVKVHHYLSIIMMICLVAPLTYTIKNHFDEPEILVPTILVISSLFHTTFNFIFYIINYHHIQNVTFKMIHFSDSMKSHEEVLIQRYIDKCIVFHGASIFCFYLCTFITIALPSVTEQTFPTLAEYPFDVFYQPLKTIIYIQQSIAGILVSGQLCTNIFMALLLWFATARFEILTEELKKVTNIYEVYKCIKTHQELLEYSMKIALIVRPFAFSSVCCSTVSLIVTCLVFITKQPMAIIIQFCGLSVGCLTEVFMYTWPAEHLIFMCYNVAQTAFNVLENNHLINLIKIWKCLQVIIMRSQKPITISIPCLLPILSLSYFTTYLSTVFSYFTTLRIMVNNDNN